MFSKILKLVMLFTLVSALVLPNFFVVNNKIENVLAADEALKELCKMDYIERAEQNLSEDDYKALLEKCEKYYEKEISQIQGDIAQTSKEKKTLQNKIYGLKKKIKNLNYKISQNNIVIKDLGVQIKDTEGSIHKSSSDIEIAEEKLIRILRTIYEEDQRTLIEVFLAEDKISDFFNNLVALEILNSENKEILENIKNLKFYLEGQKGSLDNEKEELKNVVWAQTFQKEENQKTKQKQANLLKKTKGEEALYQKHLKETEEKAKEIRQRIFQLAQVPETEAPSLEEAYKLAVYVEKVTKIRPALLLGLLKVESAIGKNVGQCNCASHVGCRHPELTYKTVMGKSQRDSFIKITTGLGMDPNTAPVSCYVNGGNVQMGGAMGPAQFMPNTWLGKGLSYGYKQKVEAITGEVPANPWRVRDAFLAMGLYLQDFGAGNQKLQTEIGAVTAYLCGTSRMTTTCRKAGGEWYRSSVMKNAAIYQEYIDDGVFD
ncbi:lytic murein transglycosylase [Candidatus Parcubacteria bacterium]|nr:lytic murein transglycosylase [Candidatus Parcubacteria bacterium]